MKSSSHALRSKHYVCWETNLRAALANFREFSVASTSFCKITNACIGDDAVSKCKH